MFDRNTYTGMDPRPDDFEAFWADQAARLATLEIPYELKPAAYQVSGKICYDLYFRSFDTSRIHCKAAMPPTQEKLPVLQKAAAVV